MKYSKVTAYLKKKFLLHTTLRLLVFIIPNNSISMELPSPTIIGTEHSALFKTLAKQALEILVSTKKKCSLCNRLYSDLTLHLKRAHNVHITLKYDEKYYKCDECDFSFVDSFKLRNHSQILHIYPCAHCPYAFISRTKLAIHNNNKHSM